MNSNHSFIEDYPYSEEVTVFRQDVSIIYPENGCRKLYVGRDRHNYGWDIDCIYYLEIKQRDSIKEIFTKGYLLYSQLDMTNDGEFLPNIHWRQKGLVISEINNPTHHKELELINNGKFLAKTLGIKFYSCKDYLICPQCNKTITQIEKDINMKKNSEIKVNEKKYNNWTYKVRINKEYKNELTKCYCLDCIELLQKKYSYIVESDFNKQNNKSNENVIVRYDRNIPAKLRIQILNESARLDSKTNTFTPSCKFCGITANETTLHIDHKTPVSKGGQTALENLQVLCELCNLQKSNKYELVINL